MAIEFGTDGWRAIIADEFTVQNVRYCAQAHAEYLKAAGTAGQGLVIGYDTRFASERFAAAAAEVAAANGIKVFLCSRACPTPYISYAVVHKNAAGATIITASHNPGEWNGYKVKTAGGASAPTEVEQEIESRLPKVLKKRNIKYVPLREGLEKGIIEYLEIAPAYLEHISKLLDIDSIRQSGLKVAVDSMYGAGGGYFKSIIGNAKTQVLEIHGERNPAFPGMKQPEPIGSNLTGFVKYVQDVKADVGLATDGDADRIGIVDEKGNPFTPLQIFALLALYLLEVRGQRGAIVKTLTTTNMLLRLGELYNVPVFETKVGFKYVAPIMDRENAIIGGEESSGFGFRGHIPERDGIFAGLCFLDFMNKTKKTPSQLLDYLYSKVGPHHYDRIDVDFPPEDREAIKQRLTQLMPTHLAQTEMVKKNTIDGFHFTLKDGSWLLFRFSGTEPLLRIYSEASSLEKAKALIAEGRKLLSV
jgi:alpha-D-glucose phosphate-specific phosphoglucomutase